jgi:hypothetical protein
VRGESNAAIYLKGTQIQVGEQWGANYSDFSTMINEINDGLKRELGAEDSQAFLKSLGYPTKPKLDDFFEWYRTPKRQILRTKPKYKNAKIDWENANEKFYNALSAWEKANPTAYEEASKLYNAYKDRANRFCAITDLLDGEAHGEMGMRILWGGHDPTYFKTNDLNINEGWANWFQLTIQDDKEMLDYLEKYAPKSKSIFEECFIELINQNLGGD